VCTVQSSLSFVSSAFHHSSSNIDEDAMVGELNIHKQRKKITKKKMNSRSSSVSSSSSSSSSSTPTTTTTTHGSIALERLEHEQIPSWFDETPGRKQASSSSSATLKNPLRNRHSLQTTTKHQKFANGEPEAPSPQELFFRSFVRSFVGLLAFA
jgi:hypothetical protein